MATSGSTDFSLVTNTIIEEAFDLCGVGSEGEPISADMYSRARRSLNLIVKTWATREHLWLRTSGSVTLVASQGTYALATLFSVKPMRVLEVRRRVTSSSLDTPMNELARQDYFELPNKASEDKPISWYYDPQLSTGTLYVWPEPDTTTASTMTLQLTYLRKIEDFDASDNDADLPQEWLQALTYALAEQLALKYGVAGDIRSEIAGRAAALMAQLEAFDNEPASLFLMPERRWC